MITYLHHYPMDGKPGQKWLQKPMNMDHSNCGYYSDRIYDLHSSTKRFYIATFGYEKSWPECNTYDRIIGRYTLHFVFEGKGTFNGQPIHAGQMFIAPHHKPYTIIQDKHSPLTLSWIGISGTELDNQLSLWHLADLPEIITIQNMEKIRTIFIDTIYGQHPYENMEMLLFSSLFKILALCNIKGNASPIVDDSHANTYFSEVMSYIDTHYAENINVRDIAHHVHISEPHLRRICTLVSNQSPQDLIAQKRLNVAKSMLVNTNASIEEIALLVGFSSHNAFSKFFTKKRGVSPQAYRLKKIEERKKNAKAIASTEANWRTDYEKTLIQLMKEKKNENGEI